MTKQVLYRYLGTNGIIESPVHLEDIFYTRINFLIADHNKILTDGINKVSTVRVSDEDLNKWIEIDKDK